jgi:hypothetical protein
MEDHEGIVSSYPYIALGAMAAHLGGSTERCKGILRKAGILPCSSVGDYGIFVKFWRAAGSQRQQQQKGEYSCLHDSKYNKKRVYLRNHSYKHDEEDTFSPLYTCSLGMQSESR